MENKTVYLVLSIFFANFFGGLHGMAPSAEMKAKLSAAVLAANQMGYMPTTNSNSNSNPCFNPAMSSNVSTSAVTDLVNCRDCSAKAFISSSWIGKTSAQIADDYIARIREEADGYRCPFGCDLKTEKKRNVEDHVKRALIRTKYKCEVIGCNIQCFYFDDWIAHINTDRHRLAVGKNAAIFPTPSNLSESTKPVTISSKVLNQKIRSPSPSKTFPFLNIPTTNSNSGLNPANASNAAMVKTSAASSVLQISNAASLSGSTSNSVAVEPSITFYANCSENPYTLEIQIHDFSKEWDSAKIINAVRDDYIKKNGQKVKNNCPFGCGYNTEYINILKEHMQTKLNMKEFKCDVCDITFNTKPIFRQHKKGKKHCEKEAALALSSGLATSTPTATSSATTSSSPSSNSKKQSPLTTAQTSKKRKAENKLNGPDKKKSRTDTNSTAVSLPAAASVNTHVSPPDNLHGLHIIPEQADITASTISIESNEALKDHDTPATHAVITTAALNNDETLAMSFLTHE